MSIQVLNFVDASVQDGIVVCGANGYAVSCRNLNTELNYLAFGSIGPIPRPLGDIPPNNLNPAFDHLAVNLPASLASPQE